MAPRGPRPGSARSARRARPARLGLGAVVAAAVLAGVLGATAGAQPAPDLERAKDLYRSAEAAMKEGRFDDAARDYGAAYESSKDPALFYKIGRANERAGRCDVAVIYYARYLQDGKPAAPFVQTTRERIRACGGDAQPAGGAAPSEPGPVDGAGTGSTAPVPPASAPPASAPPASIPPATAAEPEVGIAGGDADSGSAAAPAPAALRLIPNNRHKVAWLMTGGAVALVTLGSVLAYAANSSESDVRDLYVGFAGQPATFDAQTRKRYDEIIGHGRRYQRLSWASFGLAGAAAAGAVVLFVIGARPESPKRARLTPIVTPTGAGVAVGF